MFINVFSFIQLSKNLKFNIMAGPGYIITSHYFIEICSDYKSTFSLAPPRSSFHFNTLEWVSFPCAIVSQDIPGAPVDAICDAAVTPRIVASIEVSSQTGIKPPACTIITGTVTSSVAIMIPVICTESSAIVIVLFAVTECIASISMIISSS